MAIDGWYDEDGEAVTSAILAPSDAPAAERKDSPYAASRKRFERAWFASGCEMRGSAPYVSRSALIAFLINNDGYSDSTAKKASMPDGKIIGELLNSGLISPIEHGWKVVSAEWVTAMLLILG